MSPMISDQTNIIIRFISFHPCEDSVANKFPELSYKTNQKMLFNHSMPFAHKLWASMDLLNAFVSIANVCFDDIGDFHNE